MPSLSTEGAPRDVLPRLTDWAVRFSPLVEPVEPDTLLIDITGCQQLFGGEANLAQQVLAGLRAQGRHARAAIADTVGAAYALARTSFPAENRCHVVMVPPGQTAAHLAPLPPAALRIDPHVSARLESLGIRTIGALLLLPRASLPARFGPQLVLRLEQALGEVFEGVAVHVPQEVPSARLDFEQAVCELPLLQPVAERLLTGLFEQLRQRDLALRQLDCALYYERTPARTLSIGLSRPSRSAKHTGELLRQRLEQCDLSTGVCGVMLIARETSRWRAGQVELFDPREPEEEEALGCLIDRLANRLGYNAVLRTQLVDDYQPEMAFRYVSVAEAGMDFHGSGREKAFAHQPVMRAASEPGAPATGRSRPTDPALALGVPTGTPSNHAPIGCPTPSTDVRVYRPPSQGGLQGGWEHEEVCLPPRAGCPTPSRDGGLIYRGEGLRPVQLFPRPVPIRVIALVPDGPPTWFAYGGQEYVVLAAEGPERLETAWWRGPDIRRDYFRVTAASGAQFWLFHAFDERRWYLHGIFA